MNAPLRILMIVAVSTTGFILEATHKTKDKKSHSFARQYRNSRSLPANNLIPGDDERPVGYDDEMEKNKNFIVNK